MYIHTNICTRLVIDLDICLLTFRHARLNKCEIVENPRHMVLRNTTDWQEKLSLEDVISLDEIFLKLNPQRLWKPLGLGDVWWGFLAVDYEIDRPWTSEPWIWNNETTEVCQAWTASGQSVSWVGCAEAWIWKYLTRKCRQFSFLYLESPDVTSKPKFAELKNEGSFYKKYPFKWFILRAIWRFHPVFLVPKSLSFKLTHDSWYLMHSGRTSRSRFSLENPS